MPTVLDNPETTVILTDDDIDSEHLMLEGVEMGEDPTFSVGEVAKMFFARTPHWLRWREQKGFFTLDGKNVGTTRTKPVDPESYGQRRYTLADIEKMAHALAEKGAITSAHLRHTLRLVQAEARLWGYI